MAKFLNAVMFTPTAGGTADFTVSAAVQGYLVPNAAGASNGALYRYRAESATLSEWEVGYGFYSTGTGVLTRAVVLYNSLGTTAKINFAAPPYVGMGLPLAEDLGTPSKNYIMNGAMMVSQQNGATAGTVGATLYYPVDQFGGQASNAGVATIGQVASVSPEGSPNRIRFTVTTADASLGATDYAFIQQIIEGSIVADLKFGTASAKMVTLQFGVRAPAGTYCVVLINGAQNRSYVAEYTITAGEANTDVVKSVTIPGDTTGTWSTGNVAGMAVRWGLMAGSTFQLAAGAWGAGVFSGSANQFNFMGTNGNVFELFDVGLYEGAVAPAFRVPEFDIELDRCQRYWEKSYDYAVAPGTAGNFNGVRASLQNSAPASYGAGNFLKRKRAAPTVTLYSPNTGASGNGFDNIDRPAAATNVGETGYHISNVFGISTTPILYHFTANARM